MAKYILVYKQDKAFDWTKLPEEQVAQVMSAWGEYLGSLHKSTSSNEAFRFGGKNVSKQGTTDADNLLGGYTVIDAKDFDAALKEAERAPIIGMGGTVDVYEAFAF